MKKTIYRLNFTFILLFIINVSYGQQSPNLVPAIGNVGIGTLSPQKKLHVAGNTRNDSTLNVRGSLLVNEDAVIGKTLKVDSTFQIQQLTK